jgi:hypothetical protein
MGRSILKFIWKLKRPQIAKVIQSKRRNASNITVLDFKLLYYRSTVTKKHMVLAQKQTREPTEYNGRPRNKPTEVQSSDF